MSGRSPPLIRILSGVWSTGETRIFGWELGVGAGRTVLPVSANCRICAVGWQLGSDPTLCFHRKW